MSKKHFVALADAIRMNRAAFTDKQLSILADFCKAQNPRFMRERWLDYINGLCGPCGGRVK
jgi:hypothetical protein